MSEPIVIVDQLAKAFGDKQVLRDVSFQVPEGHTFALLGRNGAGKTTTIRVMLGLTIADAGSIRLDGIDPTKSPLLARSKVGYLAEDQTMYGWMTPMQLAQFLAPFYPTWDMEFLSDFLTRYDVPLKLRIDKMSKGQTVKLGLAMALAHRPRIVVLDDPAMGLDPIARKEFNRDLVEHLQGTGVTVLYSSHLLDEVESVADSVAILDNGQIVRSGLTDSLRADVKQIIVHLDAVAGMNRPSGLLDVRRYDQRLVLVVDQADDFSSQLKNSHLEHEIVDLRLDEIFEAFAIGRTEPWPGNQTNSHVALA